MVKRLLISAASFLILDSLWLGLAMGSFYRRHLGPIALTTPDGALAPIWAATVPVYLLMAIGIAVFVVPRAAGQSRSAAWRYGALFGWVLFGVYDFTNYSTLRDYSLTFALVDTIWGGVTCAITAATAARFAPATAS